MAYFFLDKYYKEWIEVDMFCKDPITCCKKVIRDLYKERLPYLNVNDGYKCEEISKRIRRYQALVKRLEAGLLIKFRKDEESPIILVSLDEFNFGRIKFEE